MSNEINFPKEVFPIQLQEELEKLLVTSPDWNSDVVYLTVLTMIGFAISHKHELQIKPGWIERSNLWTVIFADSGSAKTPIMKYFSRPIQDEENKIISTQDALLQAYLEMNSDNPKKKAKDLVDGCNSSNADTTGKPSQYTMIEEKFTSEGLFDTLSTKENNGRPILICVDEVSGMFKSAGQYKGGKGDDAEFALKLFGYGELKKKTVINGRQVVFDRTVSEYGSTVNANIPLIFNDESRLTGSCFRYMVYQDQSDEIRNFPIGINMGSPDRITVFYDELIHKSLSTFNDFPERQELTFSSDVSDFIDNFFTNICSDENENITTNEVNGYYSKYKSLVFRIGIIMSALRNYANATDDLMITKTDMENSIKIINWNHYHARRINLISKGLLSTSGNADKKYGEIVELLEVGQTITKKEFIEICLLKTTLKKSILYRYLDPKKSPKFINNFEIVKRFDGDLITRIM